MGKLFGIGKTGYLRAGPVKAGPLGVGCLIPILVFTLILLGLVALV